MRNEKICQSEPYLGNLSRIYALIGLLTTVGGVGVKVHFNNLAGYAYDAGKAELRAGYLHTNSFNEAHHYENVGMIFCVICLVIATILFVLSLYFKNMNITVENTGIYGNTAYGKSFYIPKENLVLSRKFCT